MPFSKTEGARDISPPWVSDPKGASPPNWRNVCISLEIFFNGVILHTKLIVKYCSNLAPKIYWDFRSVESSIVFRAKITIFLQPDTEMAITLKPLTVETQNLELWRDGYTWNNFCANFGDKLLLIFFILTLHMIRGFHISFSVRNILQFCCNALHTHLFFLAINYCVTLAGFWTKALSSLSWVRVLNWLSIVF